jgi:hypothetical protein
VRNVRRPLYLARATSDKADNAPKTPTRSETLPRVCYLHLPLQCYWLLQD